MKHIFTIIAICLFFYSCGDKECDDLIGDIPADVYSATYTDLSPGNVHPDNIYAWTPFQEMVWDELPTYLINEIDTVSTICESTLEITYITLEIKQGATLRIEKTSTKYSKSLVYKKRSYGCRLGEYDLKDIGEEKMSFTITVKSDGAYLDNFGGHDVWNLIPLPRTELEKTDKIIDHSEERAKAIVFEQTRPFLLNQAIKFANDEYEFVITMAKSPIIQEIRPSQRSYSLDKMYTD